MLELILLFIGSVLLYRYWKAEYSNLAKTIDLIPGPPKTPFLGTVLDPDGNDFIKLLVNSAQAVH